MTTLACGMALLAWAVAAYPATPAKAAIADIVQTAIGPWIEKEKPPGVIVVVRHDGRTQFFPFGQANKALNQAVTADTIFELASITKVFTTTSLAMEVRAGKMRLDDRVEQYLPYLRQNGGDIKKVALLQLATHSSSLPRTPGKPPSDRDWDKESLLRWLAQWHAPYPPGSKSLYSNLGVGLLGLAIEEHDQQPLIDVWKRQFLGPLGMHHTFFEIPPDAANLVVQGYGPKGLPVKQTPPGAWPAGGRLHSSARDMGEFLAANLGERPDHPRIMKAMRFAQEPYFKVSAKMTQGLAWQRLNLAGEFVIDKNGGLAGTSTYIGMLPERHIGVVVMANRGKCSATAVGRKLLLALAGKQHPGGDSDEEDQ
jgi:beta-lactamase class C